MDVAIEFNPSAFKHGVTEADIRWAFRTVKYDAILEEANWTDKHLLTHVTQRQDFECFSIVPEMQSLQS